MPDVLLITPPFTQLNTPYPATAYLKGFLNTKRITSYQIDLGLDVILALFSKTGLNQVFEEAGQLMDNASENSKRIFSLKQDYIRLVDDVVGFLQGKRPSLARQISSEDFLPQASRFDQLDDLEWAFGQMGFQDRAKHFATLFLEDISDFIVDTVDPQFGFSRYADQMSMSANSFDEIYARLHGTRSFIDQFSLNCLTKVMVTTKPKLVCLSVPFPGNLLSALRCGEFLRKEFPTISIALGGGFANTELRSVKDPRVFEFVDYICLDDGERPIELICQHVLHPTPDSKSLKRTFHLENSQVYFNDQSVLADYPQALCGTPDYSDLRLDQYISVIEIANPMHSLWSDGRWNKLTMAHGCYWGKCTFCDTTLDYIKRYEPIAARTLVDRMESIIAQTGESGFHFVDEAAPPKLMRELALEIIRRNLNVSWWTNIRFEKSFTVDLCKLLRRSGCIAVSGGLEVASDRLLKLIDKGVTVEQVAIVTKHFAESEIMVHAYLMYGYPTQTIQETVDSLEMVRQLFETGVLKSGFWHRFALTAHSPIGMKPSAYGVIPHFAEIQFANNDIQYTDQTGIDHEVFSDGLKKSLFNFMHGIGFEKALGSWFNFDLPNTSIDPGYILHCLDINERVIPNNNNHIFWLGNPLEMEGLRIKGKNLSIISFHTNREILEIETNKDLANWLNSTLQELAISDQKATRFVDFRKAYEALFNDFETFWWSEEMEAIRECGLVVV